MSLSITKEVYLGAAKPSSGGGTPINNEDISVTINGTYTASAGYTGLGTVSVNVPNPSTGTKSITANGVYDVTDFASADVQVPTTAPAYYIEKTKDANNKLVNGSTVIDLDGATDVGDYALYSVYAYNTNITGALDLSTLTTISGRSACSSMFQACSGITSVDLSGLISITLHQGGCSSMFRDCKGLTSVDLSSLTTIACAQGATSMFRGCSGLLGTMDLSSLITITDAQACDSMFNNTGITSVDLSSLITINGYYACQHMFSNCTSLTSVNLSSLATVIDTSACRGIFSGCTSLTSLSFPALTSTSFGSNTDQFNKMLQGVTGCTVHFPSNLQSVIGSWSDVTAGFGGTNTTVLFDLPETA